MSISNAQAEAALRQQIDDLRQALFHARWRADSITVAWHRSTNEVRVLNAVVKRRKDQIRRLRERVRELGRTNDNR